MKGRKPKPTALKELQGTLRADRQRNEPVPAIATPEPPAGLCDVARVEWERIAPELVSLKLLSKLDRAALAAYCTAWAHWIEAENQVRDKGMLVRDPNTHQPVLNPYLAIADRSLRQLRAFLVEFGLSPSSRSRINVAPASDKPKAVRSRVRA